MRGKKALEALREINTLLRTANIPSKELPDARIDHTTDLAPFYVSIVFTERCLKRIIEMNNATRKNLVEYGTFFYGRLTGKTLYIDNYLSDFEKADSVFVEAAVNVTKRNMKEKEMLTEKSELNTNPYNVVVHFHTHPAYGITSDHKVFKPNTTRYSDQDLYTYAYLQKYHQPKSENRIFFIGGLLGVDNDRSQISAVFYDLGTKDFYNIEGIYYIYHNELFKFNNFDIANSKKIEDTSGIKLMKELKENN